MQSYAMRSWRFLFLLLLPNRSFSRHISHWAAFSFLCVSQLRLAETQAQLSNVEALDKVEEEKDKQIFVCCVFWPKSKVFLSTSTVFFLSFPYAPFFRRLFTLSTLVVSSCLSHFLHRPLKPETSCAHTTSSSAHLQKKAARRKMCMIKKSQKASFRLLINQHSNSSSTRQKDFWWSSWRPSV